MTSILPAIESMGALHAAKTAVIADGQRMTYAQLHSQANRLARAILEARGGKDRIVAICLPRSCAMIVTLYAVMKSGSAYLPIAPSYPARRIGEILEDSGAVLLITASQIAIPDDAKTPRLDFDLSQWHKFPDDTLAVNVDGNDLAYVIYTSGSTGKPKGVAVEHSAFANRMLWVQSVYPIDEHDVILQKTVYTFDVSVWELFWWAMHGATAVLLQAERENDVRLVHEEIHRHSITVAHFVPSVFALFLELLELRRNRAPTSLRYVFTSGEKLPVGSVNRFNAIFKQQTALLVNLYGPTEAAIEVSHFAFPDKTSDYSSAPIGKAIWNTRLYVMDDELRELADGEEGELCIAGICLARGYHNRPEQTAKKFVQHPEQPAERLYRTGDMVWRDPATGDIHYIGRRDSQIKLRGLRIELGEIEHHLTSLAGVTESVVLVHELGGHQYLWAFVRGAPTLDEAVLKAGLAQALPAYMIPSRIVRVDTFPLFPNGKLDRRQLLQAAVPALRQAQPAPQPVS